MATQPSAPGTAGAGAGAPFVPPESTDASSAAAAERAAASSRLTHSILSAAEAAVLSPPPPGPVMPAAPSTVAIANALAASSGGRGGLSRTPAPRNATRRGLKYRCGVCGERGHNAKTCAGTKAVAAAAAAGAAAAAAAAVANHEAGAPGGVGSPAVRVGLPGGGAMEGATFLGNEAEELVEAGSAVAAPPLPPWPSPVGVGVGAPVAAPATPAMAAAGAPALAAPADGSDNPVFARALAAAKKRVVAAEATVYASRAAPLSDFSTAAKELEAAVTALETVAECSRRCSMALGGGGGGG